MMLFIALGIPLGAKNLDLVRASMTLTFNLLALKQRSCSHVPHDILVKLEVSRNFRFEIKA